MSDSLHRFTALATADEADGNIDGYAADDLDTATRDVVRLAAYTQIPEADGLHLAATLSHRLMRGTAALERSGWNRERILARIHPARAAHAASPFIRRLQEWPRGYPGDFETVEQLLEQRNRAEPGCLAYWLEQYALASSIAQQHRNKVDIQARAILDCVLGATSASHEARVLILAAGGSPDLRQCATVLAQLQFHAVLLDQDADALAFSADRLTALDGRLTFATKNVVRGLPDVQRLGPFDLVLAGGLFDYLPDKVAQFVLRQARERLVRPGGRFVFTNIDVRNPYRPWIEYLANWCLLHRSEREVRALATGAGFAPLAVSVTRERTGLALIASCEA